MPDLDLSTEAGIRAAGARLLDLRYRLIAGDTPTPDELRWALDVGYAALSAAQAPIVVLGTPDAPEELPPLPFWPADDREIPAWLRALPDPQQES